MQEIILLYIIAIQGFFIMFFEADVWWMNRERFRERATWRKQKQKQAERKNEEKAITKI